MASVAALAKRGGNDALCSPVCRFTVFVVRFVLRRNGSVSLRVTRAVLEQSRRVPGLLAERLFPH